MPPKEYDWMDEIFWLLIYIKFNVGIAISSIPYLIDGNIYT